MSMYGYSQSADQEFSELQDTVNELSDQVSTFNGYISGLASDHSNKLNLAGGTMSGNIIMGANKVTTTAVPSTSFDMCNKLYVDDKADGKLDITGGIMSGNLNMVNHFVYCMAAPLGIYDLCNKQYVDTYDAYLESQLNGKLGNNGGTITGNLSISGNITVAGTISQGTVVSSIYNGTIDSAGVCSLINRNTSVLKLSGNPNLYRIPIDSTNPLSDFQTTVLYNDTSDPILLGHNSLLTGETTDHRLQCYWFKLLPHKTVDIIYIDSIKKYVMKSTQQPTFYTFELVKWMSDSELFMFVNSNLSYHMKLSFGFPQFGSPIGSSVVNGVNFDVKFHADIDNLTGTNWSISRNGSGSIHDDNNVVKFSGYFFQFSSFDFFVNNLVLGNYYMLVILHHKNTSSLSVKKIKIYHQNRENTISYNPELFSSTAKLPGSMMTYIFRAENTTASEKFTIWEESDASIHGFLVITL